MSPPLQVHLLGYLLSVHLVHFLQSTNHKFILLISCLLLQIVTCNKETVTDKSSWEADSEMYIST